MRILYCTDVRFPIERANGVQTMATAHALATRGHDVRLLVRPDVINPPRDPFEFYDWPPEPRLRIDRAWIGGPFWLRRLEYMAAAAARLFRGRAIDVVFTRDLGIADLLGRLPARPPVVFESHGFAPVFAGTLDELVTGARSASDAKVRRLTAREASVWRRAEGYVATTRLLADELTARFGARPNLVVIPNGVRLPAEPVQPSPGGRVAIVYAGHLYPWKGVDVVIRALALVPDAHLTVLGGREGDADMTRVAALAADLDVSSRVTFAGFVPAATVRDTIARATVTVVPTLDTPSARYTSPLKMFEYMAAGRVIVASDLPPVREVLADGRNARLVPPNDPAALAGAIRALAADPSAAGRLAAQAAADVGGYAWSRRAAAIEDLLVTLVSR